MKIQEERLLRDGELRLCKCVINQRARKDVACIQHTPLHTTHCNTLVEHFLPATLAVSLITEYILEQHGQRSSVAEYTQGRQGEFVQGHENLGEKKKKSLRHQSPRRDRNRVLSEERPRQLAPSLTDSGGCCVRRKVGHNSMSK
ncbi:hypothetical protein E2C01_013476 [Portunus trituberculatus]|uniref:Uncharacterized protein n=1 Tax=Portunus trituberculatus TaxID=210409 RepID=A0A5B7DGQ6_PORTR|nr:hypothetical protein [Portunus trituberculatus]